MIIELFFSPIFLLIKTVINLIPSQTVLPLWTIDLTNLLSKGLIFFPSDVWAIVIGNIVFWLSLQFMWAIIEWVYKKIPGVE